MTKQMTVDKHLRRHLKARAKFGADKYGVPLLPFNGRNPLRDKREELLDALVYNEQDIIEREQLACELEEVHGFLYNFRQSRGIESADLDRAIAALASMAKRLTEDTERIEPDERAYVDALYKEEATVRIRPFVLGPDTPPVERSHQRLMEAMEEANEIPRTSADLPTRWFKIGKTVSVPLEPVLESIRKDGPIGHRDLLEIAAKHPAMERLEQMECSCCGKCVK